MMASIETEIHQPSESYNSQQETVVSNSDDDGRYQSKTAQAMREFNEIAGTAQQSRKDYTEYGQGSGSKRAVSAEPEVHRPVENMSYQPEMVDYNEPEVRQPVENMDRQPEVLASSSDDAGHYQSKTAQAIRGFNEVAGARQPIQNDSIDFGQSVSGEETISLKPEAYQPSESANLQPEMMVSNGDGAGHYQSKTARAMRELNEVAGTAQPEQSDPVNHGQADDSVEAISAEPEAHRPFDSRSHQPEMVASNEPLVHQPDQSTNRQQEMPDFNGDGAVRYQSKTAHAMRKFNEIAGTAKSTQNTSWDGDGRRVIEQSDGKSISTAGSNNRPEGSQRMKVDIPEELLSASTQRINRVERIMQNGPRTVQR